MNVGGMTDPSHDRREVGGGKGMKHKMK